MALFSASIFFSKVVTYQVRYHSADEPGWITSGLFHTELLIEALHGRWHLDLWQQRDSFFHMNGQLGKWLVGLPVDAYLRMAAPDRIPKPDALTIAEFTRFRVALMEGIRAGQPLDKAILMSSRLMSATFGVLCVALLYAIGVRAGGLPMGLSASLLLALTPLFQMAATRAMTDIYYVFFLLCSCWVPVRFYQEPSAPDGRAQWKLTAVWALAAGLASSVKVTGALVAGFFYFLFRSFERLFLAGKRYVLHIAAFGLLTLTVIYGLNPAFWVQPALFQDNALVKESTAFVRQINDYKHGKTADLTIYQYPLLAGLTRFPRVFLEWKYVMNEQGQFIREGRKGSLNAQAFGMTAEDQLLDGGSRRLWKFHKMLLLLFSGVPLVEGILLIAGLVLACREAGRSIRMKASSPLVVVLLFFLANYIFILATLKLNWDRYYLTTVIAGKLLAAYAIAEAMAAFKAGRTAD